VGKEDAGAPVSGLDAPASTTIALSERRCVRGDRLRNGIFQKKKGREMKNRDLKSNHPSLRPNRDAKQTPGRKK
jgi:hypothetical protein